MIISSPDKYVYSDIPGYKNEFHVKELYAREFEALLKEHFANVEMFGQRVAYGSVIAGEGMAGFVSFDSEQKSPPPTGGIERAIYNVAIASDSPVPKTFSSIYEQSIAKSIGYQALQREIEFRGSKLAEVRHAARMHEDELREELRRQSSQFAENVSRLKGELQRQSKQSEETDP